MACLGFDMEVMIWRRARPVFVATRRCQAEVTASRTGGLAAVRDNRDMDGAVPIVAVSAWAAAPLG
jgi:hypothetical protein